MTATWPSLLQLLVIAFAVARITVLLVEDAILDAPRGRLQAWIATNGGTNGYLDKLTTCQRCLGWWVSLAAFGAWARWPAGTALWAVPWAIAMTAWWFGASWLKEN